MFEHNLSPVIMILGPLQFRWYGFLYVVFIIFALFALPYVSKKRELKINVEEINGLLLGGFLIGMIGARIGFFIANEPKSLFSMEFFRVWNGGLASYGGFAGGLIFACWYIRNKDIRFYELADAFVIVFALLPCFIRLGNFINGELVGVISNVPWAVKFPGYEEFRHPVVLYSLVANLMVFIILWRKRTYSAREGILFWSFVGLYAFQRYFVDFLREYDTYLYGLSLAQWISLPLIAIALCYVTKGTSSLCGIRKIIWRSNSSDEIRL